MRRTVLCLVIAATSACTPKGEAVPPVPTISAPSTSARTDDDVEVEVRLIDAEKDVASDEQKASPPKTVEDPPKRGDKKTRSSDQKPSGKGPAEDPLSPGPPPPPPPIRQATTETVNGEVDPTSIQRAVTKEHHLFVRCLRVDASIELEATIAPSGRIAEAKSDKSIPDDPKLRDCLVEAFKQLTIQPHTSASAARVKLALALRRRATG